MINIIYDSSADMFTFMAAPNNENDPLGAISCLDELLEAVSGEFGLFASAMTGSTEEAYLSVVDTFQKVGQDEKIIQGLNLMIKENEHTVFMNDESKEEAVRQIAKDFKESINEMQGNFIDIFNAATGEDFIGKLIKSFIEQVDDMYGVQLSEDFFEDKEESDEEDSEFEEDLF